MSLAFKLKMAKQTAEKLLRDEGYTSLPIDLCAIAKSRDILVKSKPPDADGVSGMLLRHGDNFMIVYATFIDSDGFQRFSIAHELGHFFLEGHIDHVLPKDGTHESLAGFISADPYEQEADSFAAGLIMPEALFKKALDKTEIGLPAVESMATSCRSSLTATAIRYAELTDQAVAAILSTGPTIDYCILSDKMKSLPGLTWLRKGSPVPKNTATARFNADRQRVAAGDHMLAEIDIQDWLGGSRSVIANEEVVGLGRYGKTLTVLSSENIRDKEDPDDDDDDDDDDVMERWTPRFRR